MSSSNSSDREASLKIMKQVGKYFSYHISARTILVSKKECSSLGGKGVCLCMSVFLNVSPVVTQEVTGKLYALQPGGQVERTLKGQESFLLELPAVYLLSITKVWTNLLP